MMHGKKCNWWQCGNKLGLFLVLLYIICFAWYFIYPVEQEMHLAMFKMSYVGFDDMNVVSFILGAVQTYIWGYIFGALWMLVRCGGLKCKK